MITILLLLFTKHFIVDFLLQKPYQYLNKGTYGHPGGILHAMLHAFGTLLCFVYLSPIIAFKVALLDGFAHYHIDWAKVKINNKMGWGPTTHEQYWWLLGLDQFLHALTYILLVSII